jgi:hypothetical protein
VQGIAGNASVWVYRARASMLFDTAPRFAWARGYFELCQPAAFRYA